MKIKYIIKALISQGPPRRFIKNFFITGNAWGMFSKRSHWTRSGKEKVGRSTKEKAQKMAYEMERKYGNHFSTYYCPYCGKWHIGKNRDDRKRTYNVSYVNKEGVKVHENIFAVSEDHVREIIISRGIKKESIISLEFKNINN